MTAALSKQPGYTHGSAKKQVQVLKRDVLKRTKARLQQSVSIHPAFVEFSAVEKSFFADMSIVTADDLSDFSGLGRAYFNWGVGKKMKEAKNLQNAKRAAKKGRECLKRESISATDTARDNTVSDNAATAAAMTTSVLAELDPDLVLLGTHARDLCASQGITTVEALLSTSVLKLAPALASRIECAFGTARTQIAEWKRDSRQRIKTREMRLSGLNPPVFEVFDPELQSFFTTMSFTTPEALLSFRGLGREYVVWRDGNQMNVIPIQNAHKYAGKWRYSVKRQIDTAVGEATDPST